ncbi:MAG: hypothetical protein ACRDZR_02590 [Acidimicrobiales bacterium]
MDGRLTPIPDDALTAQQRHLLSEWAADRGQTSPPGDIWRVLVRSPSGMRCVGKLGTFARTGTVLPPRLRVVCSYIAVSRCGFQFEVGIQHRNLELHGFDAASVSALDAGDFDLLDPEVAAVARLSDSIAQRHSASESLTAAVRELLGDHGLVDVVLVATYFLMLSDIAAVLLPAPSAGE